MAAAEFSVKVSGAAAERSPLRWPPPLAASCRVLQNGGRRRSRAGLLSSASGPPRNPWPLLPFPGRPGRRGLQSGLSGGRGAARERRASVAGLAPRREGRGPRRGPAVGAGPARRTSPEPGLPVGRRCVGPVAGRPPRSGRARRRAVTGGLGAEAAGGRASGRPPSCGRTKGGPEGAPPAGPGPSPVGSPATLALGEEPAALLFARSGAEVPTAMLWPRSSGRFQHAPCGKG